MVSATTAARKVVSSSTLIGPFKILARAQIQQLLALALKFKPVLRIVSHVTKTSLVSSRFILPLRERPLLAGNCTLVVTPSERLVRQSSYTEEKRWSLQALTEEMKCNLATF